MDNGNHSPLQQTECDKTLLSITVTIVLNRYNIAIKPTFRTLSVTTSQKRKMPESKYLSRGVSWRQAATN
jgi:hypothetical protein